MANLSATLRKQADAIWFRANENLEQATKFMDAEVDSLEDCVAIGRRLEFLNARRKSLNAIAENHLDVVSLDTQDDDNLDFHEVSTWDIKKALEAAFMAGRRSV